ncbi:MAG TPA: Rieske (2Fe-2S) protein [Longimicrobiales bacterium]
MCDGRCGRGEAACAGAEAPGHEGYSRREFITQSTLAAVAAVLTAACGTGADILAARNPAAAGTLGGGGISLRLSDYPTLGQVGGIARADTAAGPIALVRTGAAAFSAFSMVCPHQGTTINIQGAGFVCPNHGARFSSTGAWTGGQPTSNLVAYAVSYDATAGLLTVGAGTGVPVPQQPGAGTGAGNVNLVVDLAQFPALSRVGGVARVDGNTSIPVGAARISATQFAAYSLSCTHQGTTVVPSGPGWYCPNHGATFAASGAVTRGPATTALQALTAVYDAASNKLTITGSAGGGRGRGDDD